MCDVSIWITGLGPSTRAAISAKRCGETRAIRSGASFANSSPAPAVRGEIARVLAHQRSDLGGGFLERPVLEEPGDQQVAVADVDLVVAARRSGQEPGGLHLDQRRRDDQELGGHLEVELLHLLEVLQVLLGDRRERHVVDVELALGDQVKEQVERPFENLGSHLIRHRRPV